LKNIMRTLPLFRLVSLACAAALAGCALGPDYAGPPDAAPLATQSGRFVRGLDTASAEAPVNRWWEALGDAVLNDLVQRALDANPNLGIAQARLQQSRAALNLEQANALPSVGASALAGHARLPPVNLGGSSNSSGSSSSLNLYSLGFDATWEADLFGGHRRAVQAANATAEAAEASLADVQVSLEAEVANAYINLRDRQRRIQLADESIRAQEQMATLTRQRLERGTASNLDLIRVQNQLDGTRSDQVPLQADMESYLNQLATLVGQEPGTLDAVLVAKANAENAMPLPPAQVAVGDPQTLLRRRPDIRAAERTLAADTAKIGQAEAARYPSLKLFGVIGLGGTHPSDLTKLDDFALVAAPMLSWNFLDFGRNKARVTQAERVRDEAEMKYRQSVLEALRDAEDSLSRFRYGRVTVATVARTKASADRALDLAQQRYRAGTGTLIEVLDTTRQQISAQQNLSQAEAALTRSFVGIQKALGLGWSS
jgi:NodT family efflux transporter outer membrane factor (OMF) lipoprotein